MLAGIVHLVCPTVANVMHCCGTSLLLQSVIFYGLTVGQISTSENATATSNFPPLVHSKYKLMETNMDKAKQNMKDKVPEIERSLELVRHLQERQVMPGQV